MNSPQFEMNSHGVVAHRYEEERCAGIKGRVEKVRLTATWRSLLSPLDEKQVSKQTGKQASKKASRIVRATSRSRSRSLEADAWDRAPTICLLPHSCQSTRNVFYFINTMMSRWFHAGAMRKISGGSTLVPCEKFRVNTGGSTLVPCEKFRVNAVGSTLVPCKCVNANDVNQFYQRNTKKSKQQ
ncbi:hypothetical protein M0804_011808 [Polistes exclamans]|nr:hypothetical protein M0804_011808 [Polistes exclamans]